MTPPQEKLDLILSKYLFQDLSSRHRCRQGEDKKVNRFLGLETIARSGGYHQAKR